MKTFSIDSRSLALFRVGLGLVLLYFTLSQVAMIEAFHVRGGITPHETLREFYGPSWSWSINWLSESATYQFLLLGLLVAAASCLIIGWRTKLATLLGWLLVNSFNVNAPLITGGGDVLLGLLLFWSIFLPLESRWSIDTRKKSAIGAPPFILSAASAAVLLQMAWMYWTTGLSKWNDVWIGGSALDVIFSNPRMTRPFGEFLSEHPWLTSPLTRGTLFIELTIPFLLLSPWKTIWCRSFALLLLIPFHLAIELSMEVMLFSFVSIVGLLAFIPSLWWRYPPFKQLEISLSGIFCREEREEPVHESRQVRRKRERQAKRQSEKFGDNLVPRLANGFVIACLVYVFFYGILTDYASAATKRKLASYQRVGELLNLKQTWNMFSDPRALCHDVSCIARLKNGTQIDLLREGLTVSAPEIRPETPVKYPNTRSMILTTALTYPQNEIFRKDYLEYMSRTYKEKAVKAKEEEPLECYLMYYLVGAHSNAAKASLVRLAEIDFLSQGKYLAGRRHGPWILRYDSGAKKAEGPYSGGLPDGKWIFWAEDGTKQAEGFMKQGKPVGKWTDFRQSN